jgi:hypothetical protein
MNKIVCIVCYLILGIISIFAAYLLFDTNSRVGGIVFCISISIIGLPIFRRQFGEYMQTKKEGDEQKSGSKLLRLSQSGGLVFVAICISIYVIINWAKLN